MDSQKNLEKLFILDALDVESVKAGSLAKINHNIDSLVEAIASETRRTGTNAKSRRELREKQRDIFVAVLLLIDDTYDSIRKHMESTASQILAEYEMKTLHNIGTVLGIPYLTLKNIPVSSKTRIVNTPVSGWTYSQWVTAGRNDFRNRFKRLIIDAGNQGLTSDEVNRRILGSSLAKGRIGGSSVLADMRELSNSEYRTGIGARAKRDLDNMAHTFYSMVYNEMLLDEFKANARFIKGIKHISILDSRTTELCRRYSNATWTLDGTPLHKGLPYLGSPPYHNNCRSIHVPVFLSTEELRVEGILPENIAGLGGDGYDDYTFDEWLSELSETEQNRILGSTFANNWRNGRVKAEDFFNRRK